MKIQQLTDKKRGKTKYFRDSLSLVMYGCFMVGTATIVVVLDPLTIVTDWYLDMREDSFLYNMWQEPPYKLFLDVWAYNYSNAEDYLRGDTEILKLQEIGPFKFREFRTNENMTVIKERGVLSMKPKIKLQFLEDESISRLEDLTVTVPNIVLLAMSTLVADRMGYIGNSAAYYAIQGSGSGSLFKNFTMKQLFWGYQDSIVSTAHTLLPGWIDFNKIGILDRFYAQRPDTFEIELGDKSKMFSVKTWNDSPGLKEQGFTDVNTSIPCNLIEGSYEGIMLTPGYPKGEEIKIFRKQACRIYPLLYEREFLSEYGFNVRRYVLSESAFSKKSPYACSCSYNCLPEGFVDIKGCYYDFPIALSKPHFQDVDPIQRSYFEGMTPDPEKYNSFLQTMGVPIALEIKIQVNLAVRTSPGNPITKPFKDKVLPLIWLSMYCKQPAPEVITILRLRFVIAPPLVITLEVILFIIGLFLGVNGFYCLCKMDIGTDTTENIGDRRNTEQNRRQMKMLNASNRKKESSEEAVLLYPLKFRQ